MFVASMGLALKYVFYYLRWLRLSLGMKRGRSQRAVLISPTIGCSESRLCLLLPPVSSSESMLAMQPEDEKKDSSALSYVRIAVVLVFALLNIWHLVVEHVERQSRQELLQIKAALLAEVKSLKDRLDAQLLRQAEAKSNFDLFNEHFLKSREQK